MSQQDKPAGFKSLFAWNVGKDHKAEPEGNDSLAETPITIPDDDAHEPLYYEGNLDVTLPSLPVVDVPIVENPRTEALNRAPLPAAPAPEPTPAAEAQPVHHESSFFSRMKIGLSRTRDQFTNGMVTLLIGGKEIDDELLEEIETQMLVADMGIDATRTIIDRLTERVSRKEQIGRASCRERVSSPV